MKIITLSFLTPGIEQAWLQHLRDFDVAHPGCHFQVLAADSGDKPVTEILDMLAINPALDFLAIFPKEDK